MNQARPSGVKHLPSLGLKNPGEAIVKPIPGVHLDHGFVLNILQIYNFFN
jgi:hypothetical protein